MFGRKLSNVYTKLEKSKELSDMDCMHYEHYECYIATPNKDRNYWLHSTAWIKIRRRIEVVETLKGIDYKRGNDNWTSQTVAAFIDEVFGLRKDYDVEKAAEISNRYNVDINKLNQQASFFISLKRSTYSLNWYFSEYELVSWKYRDVKTLKKALQNETISEREIQILKELGQYIVDRA